MRAEDIAPIIEWNDEADEALKILCDSGGHSYAAIAKLLGHRACAVISRIKLRGFIYKWIPNSTGTKEDRQVRPARGELLHKDGTGVWYGD